MNISLNVVVGAKSVYLLAQSLRYVYRKRSITRTHSYTHDINKDLKLLKFDLFDTSS